MMQENSQKTSQQDKLDLLMKQMKNIQNEMKTLQEQQQDGLSGLVHKFIFVIIYNKIFLIIIILQ
jgi:hypothetical protein